MDYLGPIYDFGVRSIPPCEDCSGGRCTMNCSPRGLDKCPMETLDSTFGQRIRFLRESTNQSLSDVADAVGCSKAHIHELEAEKSKNPGLNIVRALAIHFMIPVAALVETNITAQYRRQKTSKD